MDLPNHRLGGVSTKSCAIAQIMGGRWRWFRHARRGRTNARNPCKLWFSWDRCAGGGFRI